MRFERLVGIVFAFLLLLLPAAAAAADVQVSERVQTLVVVRAQPSTGSVAIGALRPGERLELIGEVPYWREVRLPDGSSGFVSKAWTIVAQQPVAGPFALHAIDVGTGLALFVEGPGFNILYDGGSNDDSAQGSGNRLLAFLTRTRPDLTTIDHLILSHPHKDHVELLPEVIRRYQVRNVWDSGRVNPICGYRLFLQATADEPGAAYHDALSGPDSHRFPFAAKSCYGKQLPAVVLNLPAGTAIDRTPVSLGPQASMTFLHADGNPHGGYNENSLVVRLDLGTRRILFMGDAEAGGRKDPNDPPAADSIEGELLSCCRAELKADVLVAGHHGSKTSSRTAFVDAVGAKTFIISAGPTRYSGVTLPDQVIVDELTARGQVLRTDLADRSCATSASKIGRDADGKPGGCDNILIRIAADGQVSSSYERLSD